MILKSYDLKKPNLELNKILLFYGKNEGLKNETIKNLLADKNEVSHYDELEILQNNEIFFDEIFSKSLFEKEKIIVIKRATDKILKIIEELNSKNLKDVAVIINANNLEKRSKLRTFFEKNKKYVCVPFYADTEQTLSKLTYNFLKEKNILISQANTNLIINKCNGDREILFNELRKLEYFTKGGKKINTENIEKLTNLVENHSIQELIDNCLAKNEKKTIYILKENNFSTEDTIVIIRSFIIKAKKILALTTIFETSKNIDLAISSAKPPIFWKDKEITKQQIYKWKPKNIRELIYKLSNIELKIKKNIVNSVNLITDFILEQTSTTTNN